MKHQAITGYSINYDPCHSHCNPPHHISYSVIAMHDLDNPHYYPKHCDFSSETKSNLKPRTIFVIKTFNYQVLIWLKTSYSPGPDKEICRFMFTFTIITVSQTGPFPLVYTHCSSHLDTFTWCGWPGLPCI